MYGLTANMQNNYAFVLKLRTQLETGMDEGKLQTGEHELEEHTNVERHS